MPSLGRCFCASCEGQQELEKGRGLPVFSSHNLNSPFNEGTKQLRPTVVPPPFPTRCNVSYTQVSPVEANAICAPASV